MVCRSVCPSPRAAFSWLVFRGIYCERKIKASRLVQTTLFEYDKVDYFSYLKLLTSTCFSLHNFIFSKFGP
ncbi:hypothetical protein HanRHA438_Chr01g0021861 [Helianthus annuus]|uniref:Uncharacterized protein n=1 Tax=Helianthus annuus TaxID=4232 RepID=A0A9K3JVK1_HELAN|nr:hypothetical protein HanXRQr2_Chr01g0021311 [Helianthus annuus]KAJ0947966.1 hypothetical protein HanRHA438_Chr01g0021861 [Helianthus annuus]KAJ0956869.1 hypothetical protein HanPSC8_Chr01g0020601 [Helianthus annuus]